MGWAGGAGLVLNWQPVVLTGDLEIGIPKERV